MKKSISDQENLHKRTTVDMLRFRHAAQTNEVRSRLVSLRSMLNYNQKQVAERLGLIQNYVSRIERGDVDFIIEIIYSYVSNFNVNPMWLLYGIGNPFDKNQHIDIGTISEYIHGNEQLYNKRIKELETDNIKLSAKIEMLKELLAEKEEAFANRASADTQLARTASYGSPETKVKSKC